MASTNKDKKLIAAKTIFCAADILLNQNTSVELATEITAQLNTVLKFVMPFLRGQDITNQFTPAAKIINDEHKKCDNSPLNAFTNSLCNFAHIAEEEAIFHAIPALCYAMHEDKESRNSLIKTTKAICGNDDTLALQPPLLFIGETLGIKPLEFIGDDQCIEFAKSLAENTDFSYEILLETVYGIFHKVKVLYLLSYAKENKEQKISQTIIELFSIENPEKFVDDPIYTEKKERMQFVKGLQKYTLETLILTKKFLEENNLRFYLTEGTLLGAVRHNGFIPWDDDVDIAMPREDYDKLVELAKDGKIPPELNFDALENNPKHWVLGAKMQLTRPTPYIQHKVTKLSKYNGPYVDIFPLDYAPHPTNMKLEFSAICVKISRRLLFIKTGYSKGTKKKPARILARIFLPIISNKRIEKFAIKKMKKFYNGDRKYMVNFCSYYPYYKEIFLTPFFGEPVYIDFEGVKMPVPCEYDYMLKTVYGKNYDTIPPVHVTAMRKHAFEINPDVKE